MDEDMLKVFLKMFASGIVFSALLLSLLLLCGCKEVEYVPVETVRTEYVSHTDTVRQTNSIIDRQTTVVCEVDSETMAQYGIQLKNAERAWLIQNERLQREVERLKEARNDNAVKADTIRVPVPVERKLTKWEKVCLDYGKVTLGGTVCAVLMGVGFVVLWIRRRR